MRAIEKRDGEEAAKLMADHLKDATTLLIREQARQQEALMHERISQTQRPVRRKPSKSKR
jgi:GntR family transcriptional repressor for pyruvate dehydrogenase complex